MNKRKVKAVLLVSAAVLAAAALAACSQVQPSVGQYAIVTGHGSLSSQQVIGVVQPGQDDKFGSGTTSWYVPSDVRNFVTQPSGGDRTISAELFTGAGTVAATKGDPPMPVYIQSYLGFEINPAVIKKAGNYQLATLFLSWCLKYGCATQTAQNDNSNAGLAHSSSPGWENALQENFGQAIDNATRKVIGNQQPSLWNNQQDYSVLATAVEPNIGPALQQLDGSFQGEPYFCGPDSTLTNCAPFTFNISKVVPANEQVVNAYNQASTAGYLAQASAARVAAAKSLYGPYAYYVLAQEDLISACNNAGLTLCPNVSQGVTPTVNVKP